MIKLLFFCFLGTNSRLKNKKFHFESPTWWVHFCFLTSIYEREADKWKLYLKYYSLNVGELLEIDTSPYISKNLL